MISSYGFSLLAMLNILKLCDCRKEETDEESEEEPKEDGVAPGGSSNSDLETGSEPRSKRGRIEETGMARGCNLEMEKIIAGVKEGCCHSIKEAVGEQHIRQRRGC